MELKRIPHLQRVGISPSYLAITLVILLLHARDIMPAGPLRMYVVNYPLKYFAERIGGDHVGAEFPAPPRIAPAYWIPDIPTVAAYQQADLIRLNGANYSNRINKVSLPLSKRVDISKMFKDRTITVKVALTHTHGPGEEHAHEGIAFTTWLDFDLAVKQAEAIEHAFSRKKPAQRNSFAKNFKSLKRGPYGP